MATLSIDALLEQNETLKAALEESRERIKQLSRLAVQRYDEIERLTKELKELRASLSSAK